MIIRISFNYYVRAILTAKNDTWKEPKIIGPVRNFS